MVCMILKFLFLFLEFFNGCFLVDFKDYSKKNVSIMYVCNKLDFKENLCKIIYFMFVFIIKF